MQFISQVKKSRIQRASNSPKIHIRSEYQGKGKKVRNIHWKRSKIWGEDGENQYKYWSWADPFDGTPVWDSPVSVSANTFPWLPQTNTRKDKECVCALVQVGDLCWEEIKNVCCWSIHSTTSPRHSSISETHLYIIPQKIIIY